MRVLLSMMSILLLIHFLSVEYLPLPVLLSLKARNTIPPKADDGRSRGGLRSTLRVRKGVVGRCRSLASRSWWLAQRI